MRPLLYSINVTLDGCTDHRTGIADEDLHRNAMANIERADALLFGRVTYEMMEAGWRRPDPKRPQWMEPFARVIDAAKKYVVSSTLDHVDWNSELIRGDLETVVLGKPPMLVRAGARDFKPIVRENRNERLLSLQFQRFRDPIGLPGLALGNDAGVVYHAAILT